MVRPERAYKPYLIHKDKPQHPTKRHCVDCGTPIKRGRTPNKLRCIHCTRVHNGKMNTGRKHPHIERVHTNYHRNYCRVCGNPISWKSKTGICRACNMCMVGTIHIRKPKEVKLVYVV